MTTRERLPDRRPAETFDLVAGGLKYVCTVGRFADGRIGELFLGNHKSNSAADTSARDAAITFSIAVQHGADPETIRSALCRDADGKASGPLGVALDLILGQERIGSSSDEPRRYSQVHRTAGPENPDPRCGRCRQDDDRQ
jgi:hypothetical protein